MKRFNCIANAAFCLGLACLSGLTPFEAKSATVSITPSTVTNDFYGTVVMNITGLSVGQSVAVEQYLDANGNGVIDSGQENLVRGFTVTDGQAPSIAGVRYVGVPGDDDGLTNGQIRVELPYPGANDTLARIAGSYLVRVFDPLGGFTPRTNSFTILQKTYPQGVSGQVTNSGNGLPLANAVVVMVVDNGGGFGTVADASGHFTLYSPVGDYFVVSAKDGFVYDQSAGAVTITSNSFLTKNLSNLPATRTISGKVSDIGSGVGLPGLFLQCETSDGLFSLTFSDPSGNYTLSAMAGDWKVKVGEDSGVGQLGYITTGSKINTNVTSGSASNINFQFIKASALIYGTVTDNHSNVMAGLSVRGNDMSWAYDLRGQTDANGRYSVGLFAGSWNLGPDNQQLAAEGMLGQAADVSVTNGQAFRQDFVVTHAGSHLRGRVIDESGSPLGNMEVIVQKFSGQGPGSTSVYPVTQNDGSFDAGVSAGQWNMALECSSASDRGVVSPSLYFDVVDGVDQNNIIMIAKATSGQISGTVQDNNGVPIHVAVYTSCSVNGTNYSACGGDTDENGNFQIQVFNGNWQLGISGDLTSRGYDNPPNRTVNVSGGSATADLIIYPLGQTPPSLVPWGYSDGQFRFRVYGSTEQRYRIEVTTNLKNPGSWVTLRTNTAYGGIFDFTDTNAPSGSPRFYRAVLVQ